MTELLNNFEEFPGPDSGALSLSIVAEALGLDLADAPEDCGVGAWLAREIRRRSGQDIATLIAHTEGRIHHANSGRCPDALVGHDSRDPNCPVCRALDGAAQAEPVSGADGLPTIWLSWSDAAGYGYWPSLHEAELSSAEDFEPVEYRPAGGQPPVSQPVATALIMMIDAFDDEDYAPGSYKRIALERARAALAQRAGGQDREDADIDGAFEAVRRQLCKLPRYSFFLADRGNIRRHQAKTGNWLDFEQVHTLFDPVSVDAALDAMRAGREEAR